MCNYFSLILLNKAVAELTPCNLFHCSAFFMLDDKYFDLLVIESWDVSEHHETHTEKNTVQ